ncbi:MAG: family transporter [Frankiales bacterium]|nr:family transporter [Frankiales bacterium]
MTAPGRQPVPVRTIAATIAMVLATVVAVVFVMQVQRVLVWLVVSAFLATCVWPVVGTVEHRTGMRRSLATLLVFLVLVAVIIGVVVLLVAPLVNQGREFASQLPDYIAQAREGKGPVGHLVTRFHLDELAARNQQQLRDSVTGLGSSAAHVLAVIANTVAAALSVLVLTYLMVLEGPRLLAGALGLLGEPGRTRAERVGRDCARAVTGYMAGNLVISVICGTLTFLTLVVLGVPYAGVIAVFVGLADLLPLVGATLGAVVATAVAFLHSIPAGVITIVFFVVYQQLENHLLQPVVLSRTVDINPLAVLVSVLIGADLAGILGALLAIPVAGIVQVLGRDLYDGRRGALKPTPTVGEDQRPVRDRRAAALPGTAPRSSG